MQQDIQEKQELKPHLMREENDNVERPQILKFGDLHMNTEMREVTRAGRRIELTTTEYNLLQLFMSHPYQILDRQTILDRVWGYDFLGETNIIEVYVRYLREKIEEEPGSPRMLLTVRGRGYVFNCSTLKRVEKGQGRREARPLHPLPGPGSIHTESQ